MTLTLMTLTLMTLSSRLSSRDPHDPVVAYHAFTSGYPADTQRRHHLGEGTAVPTPSMTPP